MPSDQLPDSMRNGTTPNADWPSEFIRQTSPFIVRRVVKWHECDPAGVVYAPQFMTYASSANQLFLGHLLGGRFQQERTKLGVEFPAKAYQVVFYSSLWPDDYFDMAVSSVRIGRTSFTNQVVGTTLSGKLVFAARVSPICVMPGGPNGRHAVPIPERLKAALHPHLNPKPHPLEA